MIVEHRIYTFRRQGRGAIVTFAAAAHMDTEEAMPAELTEDFEEAMEAFRGLRAPVFRGF